MAQSLVTVNPVFLGSWLDALRPVRGKLTSPLAAILRDKSRPASVHALATDILADYASDDPDLIADLLMDADPKAYGAFFRHRPAAAGKTRCLCCTRRSPGRQRHPRATRTQRGSRIDGRNVKLGQRLLSFAWGRRVRSCPCYVTVPTPGFGASSSTGSSLWEQSPMISPRNSTVSTGNAKPTPAQGQQFMDAVLFHPETSMRRALILALGTYGTEEAFSRRAGPTDGQAARPLPQRPRRRASTVRRNGPCGSGSSRRSSRNWMPS